MYFVTICTYHRELIFGNIRDGEVQLNKLGNIVDQQWRDIPNRYLNVQLDQFVIMPNHVHGIIHIVGAQFIAPNDVDAPKRQGAINRAPTLGNIIRTFKALATCQIHRQTDRVEPIWQRNYHDHIIRNEKSLHVIRQYILNNPSNWDLDPENPTNNNRPLHSLTFPEILL